MTNAEKIAMVEAMSEETNDNIVSSYLFLAGQKICHAAYPFNPEVTEVPAQYEYLQIEAAVYLLSKRGIVGQTSSTENGITRVFENGDLPDSMLRSISPVCRTVS